MEDGRILTPRPSYIQPLTTLSNDTWKSQSLPGFYNRPTSPPPPQSFKDAFTSSYSPFSKRKLPTPPNNNTTATHFHPHVNEGKAEVPTSNGYGDEKKSRRFLGGLFRRRKKEENSSNSSESDSDGFRKGGRFFGKKGKKRDPKLTNSFGAQTADQVMLMVPDSKEQMKSPLSSPQTQRGFDNYFITTNGDRVIKMSPTGSLGRVCNVHNDAQPLGIPHIPAQSNLGRKGVSISHDSLAPSAASWNSESAYGSINSSMRSSRLGRSSSTDTLTRKGRREALKSRVEKLREKHTGSSSEEDGLSLSSQFGSETSLNKSSTSSRSRASRTERYLRRKSQELETLKVETEKDKRNREVVQARILEIQKSQKLRDVGDKNDKPKWSAKLVYQVSNQYDHEPVIIRNLSESPSSSRARSNSSHPIAQTSVSLTGGPYSYPRNNFQVGNATHNGIQNQRSVSYESNINNPFLSPNFTNKAIPTYANSGGFLPPVPPPRDRSRLLSPCEPSRPSSYSFENINQDPMLAPHNTNGVPVPYRNSFHKESSPCPSRPVPPLSPNYIGMAQQLPPTGQCRRSMSEKHLSLTDCMTNDYSNPPRTTPPKVHIPSYDAISAKEFVRPVSSQLQYSDHAYPNSSYLKSYNEKSSKCIPMTNVPPSPSSDYSSYVSDNSLRTSQLQPMSLPPEMVSQSNLSVKLSDSSNSSSPRIDRVQFRPNEFIGSLSQSDIPSPAVIKPMEKAIDSDSSQSSSKGVAHKISNRPLSMVAEKSESSEKGSPPVTCKQKPEPPKRGSSSLTKNSRDLLLKHLELIKELEKDETFIGRQKKFEEVFKKEKERLQKSKCANFEEALNELEEIYKSLNLNSEDIMEGAERRDSQNVQHGQTSENSLFDRCHSRLSEDQADSRSVAMSVRRSSTPDKTKDDLHYRRVQLSNRNQPDVKKALQITGSYMLVSPVHVPPSPLDIEIPKEDRAVKEADITFDDVTYRNSQRANSIKIIDPQPPFGIPLEPIKQTSHIDYLHHPLPVEEIIAGLSKEEPDIVTDDLAFRNLRKDNRTASNKSLNVSELDEILSEANDSPHFNRRMLRSASADRIVSSHPMTVTPRKLDFQTPRKVKQQQRAKRSGKFVDTFKEALTDSESSSALNWKRNPSWIERANLSDNKWENMSTSTETLTELSSTKALSQPDIRHAIIKESRASCGGPSDPFSIELEPESFEIPHLVRVHTFHNTTESPRKVGAKSCQSLDAILNSKPKPFYLTRQPSKETQLTQSPVDIAKLDHLISTLSSLESSDFEKGKMADAKDSIDNLVSESAVKFNKANTERAFNEGNKLSNNFCSVGFSSFPSASSMTPSVGISVTKIPGPITAERVIVDDDPVQGPLSAVCPSYMRTNKVETMLVSSQQVEDRDKRAKSVPSSPRPSSALLQAKTLIHKSPSSLELPKPVPCSKSSSATSVAPVEASQPLSSAQSMSFSSASEKLSGEDPTEGVATEKKSSSIQSHSCPEILPSNSKDLEQANEDEEEETWVTPTSSNLGSSHSDTEESVDSSSTSSSADSHENRPSPNSRHLKSSSTPPRISGPERSTESEKRKRRTEYERTRLSNERKKPGEEKPELRRKTGEERPEVGKKTAEEKPELRKKSKEEEKRKEPPPKQDQKRIDDKREKGRERKREANGRGEQRRPGVLESGSKSRLKKREEIEKKGKERGKGEEREINRRSSPKDLQKDIDLKGSDIDSSKMVRENGVMKVATKSSPLKPIRSQLTADQDVDKMELEKRERIQRYKEDRRKQMAARYGTTEPSSSDEENSNTTTSAYRRKRRPRTGLDSSSTDLSTGEGRKTRENGSSQELKVTKVKEGSSSEDLRNRLSSAKRLDPLSGSASILTSPTLVAKNAYNPSIIQDENKGSKRRETLFDQSLQRIASQEGRGDSADSTLSGSDGRGGRRRPSIEERDKSHKRKSHLNRASTSEEAVYPHPPNVSHLSDSSEDAPRRRRRRTPTATDSPFASSPPVTPPTTGIADSPIIGRSSKKSQVAHPPVLLPPLKSPSLLAAHGSHSAPSTLDSRFKVDIPCKAGAEAEEASFKNSFNKATPSKVTPLRKPDIPDVLKPKEPPILTSPGVVRTPNSSRPSSVVIEKPPVGPEGVVSRVPLPRSYLRKTSETGTCFMASRREKRGDDSAETGPTSNKDSDGAGTPSESKAASHLDLLTAQALELKSRAEELSEETMVLECQRYLSANKDTISSHRTSQPKDALVKAEAEASHPVGTLSGSIGLTSDTGQKNWGGGPEGSGDKVIRRLAFEEEVREKLFSSDAAPSSGPPYNDDDLNAYQREGDNSLEGRQGSSLEGPESPPRTRSPLDSILKRRSSREDSILSSSSSDKSSQGILKKASPRGSCSFDLTEGDPRPILKKRSSAEEDTSDPKSILKKKSLTDDEFEYERPRSILKGARSREDLMDRSDGITSPTPILKRSSRGDSEGEGGELRPILKRRDTSDGVRHSVHMSDNEGCDTPQCRVRSDSAPDAGMLTRSPAPSSASAGPTHGILKRRTPIDHSSDVDLSHVRTRRSFASDREESEEQRRPLSPSLVLLSSAERPLSVAERIAGMEALQTSQVNVSPSPLYSPGVKPKVRTSTEEGAGSPFSSDRENRRNSWVSPTRPENVSFEPEKVTEAFNPMFNQASRVTQKAAFFAKLEQESGSVPATRKDRGARFSTQPVTEGEVNQAAKLADGVSGRESAKDSVAQARVSIKSSSEALSDTRSSGENTFHSLGRRASAHDLTYSDSGQNDALKGILKNEHGRDRSKESPRSILKPDSRRSSVCENDPLRGILKADSPMTSTVGSPEHDARPLRSVLKKESSVEETYRESKEIRSILKPESECLEPEMSSDSSSELAQSSTNGGCGALTNQTSEFSADTYNTVMTAGDYAEFCRMSRSSTKKASLQKTPSKQGLAMKSKDNLAEALRQIEPIRDRSKGRRDMSEEKREKENHLNNNSIKSRRISLEEKSLQNGTTHHRQEEEVIDEIKSSFEENMRSLTDLSSHEESSTRVTFRQKTHQKSSKQTERWTMNDFSSCDSASRNEKLSPSNSDSSSSSSPPTAFTSPNAALPPTPPFSGVKASSGTTEGNPGALPYSRSSPITIASAGGMLEKPEGSSTLMTSSSGSSINARLVALQKNGEEGWKNRLPRDGEAELEILSPKLSRSKARPTSLLERVTLLETSSQQWKGRVSQSDATKFTVAHKMASASSVPSLIASKTEVTSVSSSSKVTTTVSGLLASPSSSLPGFAVSPASERKRRTPMPKVFKSKTGSCIPDLINKNAAKESGARVAKEFARSISVESEATKEERPVVNIPRIDDDYFDTFFSSSALASRVSTNDVRIDYSDFDQISSNTTQLVVQRRNIKATRKYQTTKNPLKSLAAREDLKDEYIDVKLGAGERELRRMKVEELSKSSSFAMEALAGLASKENFSAVSLKKVEDSPVVRELAPFNDLMLLQVKGRKRPQVRLVRPCCESVNAGDDFLLVTPNELFHYKGEFSNVIERAVASEIASYILQTKDLGTASVLRVTDVRDASPTATKERFWSKLGGNSESSAMPAGLPDEDDDYEAAIVASNKIFEVRDEALVPIADTWGLCPKCEILKSDKVLVFDFGSEVYLWGGKRTSTEDKKKGLQLLRELWKEEYDYSDCDINPITPSTLNSTNKSCMNGLRPKWGVCGKITENVETILFKEKFLDWPDTAQQTRIKEIRREADHRVDPVNDLEPCDVRSMIESQPEDPELVLEMSRLGRGVQFYDEEERRMHNISTNEFKVWHIAEHEKYLKSSESAVHFFSEETYVVRWYYHVTATGRTLKGTPSKHNVTGRSRVAYFFWQGKNSSISDKGVSALMTVEMDEERGPHVRVTMGFEPPAFLNLFQGQLVIHTGKREEMTERSPSNRLFIMRGESENEAHLMEVPLSVSHLRSKGCLILISPSKGVVFLWIGCKAANHIKQIATKLAKFLQHSRSSEIGWKTDSVRLKEEREGTESSDFKFILGLIGSITPYHSLLSESRSKTDVTPRVWKLEVCVDELQPNEVLSTYRIPGVASPFPIWQEEIYSVTQPALFLIDTGSKVFVWQGWFPDEVEAEDDVSSASTGSAFLRFTFARRSALQTALLYVSKLEEINKGIKMDPPEMAISGMESLEFTNLFPIWTHHSDVETVQEKEGRWKKGTTYLVKDVYKQLCRSRYTLDELQKKPLPDGVDPSRLEKYLSEEEFEEVLGTDRGAFVRLPSWKKLHLKKKANLF